MLANKRALIVTPYLSHLGGGERYMLEAAAVIEKAGYQLYFAWDNLKQLNKLTNLLGIKLTSPKLDKNVIPLYHSKNPIKMYQVTRGYDLVFYLSDGSIPLLGSKKNLLHIQVPFHGVGGHTLVTQLKLKQVDEIVVNSHFTKRHIDQEFAVDSAVVYPPIQHIKRGKKKKLILSVGRFEPSLNVKRHDVMIEAFKKLSLKGYHLALVGGSSDDKWLSKLQEQVGDSQIDLYPNLSYDKLLKLYQEATIYWHAAGYGVDEGEHPELCEHFGITTAEAITAGCIPLIVPKGGQVEVVPDSRYHWESIDELLDRTRRAASGKLAPPALPPNFTSSFTEVISNLVS